MMNLILERAADRCLDKKAKYVIEKLISICGPEHKQVLEEEVLHQIVEQCSSSLFCTFVDKDPIDLSRVQGQITGTLFSTIVTLLAHHTSYRLRARIDRRMTHDLTIMLRKCIEAGLSTQPYSYTNGPFVETPLSVAVRTRNLDLVKLLYRLGAVSNKELHEASHNEMFVMFLDKNKELREYVDLKASNPRGLQDLCCLSVSRYIGCRADRKHRALSLDLPMHLVEQVLFYDVKF
ncbi:hypothetical protein BaRGS_00030488 [Batillaria attramentaria]|uniref:SOCS box domain-containing protein n=1 Tax=Batillaria attramentaria TaxID=370345 RepID=A0ABD0JUC4_9CAEN